MAEPANQMTLEALRSVPLFASLDDDAARDLRNLLSEKACLRTHVCFGRARRATRCT